MKIDVKKFKEDYPNMTTTELMGKYNIKYEKLKKLKKKLNLPQKKNGRYNSKYYTFNKRIGRWIVQNGSTYYASFKTKNEAKRAVYFLKRNNWNIESVQKYTPKPKYYNQDKRNGTWRIEKGGKWFASVNTEEEAKRAVKFLKRNDWDKELFQKYKNEIIKEW